MNLLSIETDLALRNCLAQVASNYIGITEVGGDNKGQMVERFQRAVDGKATGEPFCLGFDFYCIKETQKIIEAIFMQSLPIQPQLFDTEHVQTMWNKTSKDQRRQTPRVGDLMLWAHYDKLGKITHMGHVGIVIAILNSENVLTVEGNTSNSAKGSVRNGDGIYAKSRNIKWHYGSMRPLGFLSVW